MIQRGKIFRQIKMILSVLICFTAVVSALLLSSSLFKKQKSTINNANKNMLVSIQKQIDYSFNVCFKLAEQASIDSRVIDYLKNTQNDNYNLVQAEKAISQNRALTQKYAFWGIFKEGDWHYITDQGILGYYNKEISDLFNTDLTLLIPQIDNSHYDNDFLSAAPYSQNSSDYITFVKKFTPENSNQCVYAFVCVNVSRIFSEFNDFSEENFSIYVNNDLIYGKDKKSGKNTLSGNSEYLPCVSYKYVYPLKPSSSQFIFTIMSLILFVSLGVLLIRFLSEKIYRPVRSIIERLSADIDYIPECEETEYINQYFDLIENYNKNLVSEVHRLKTNAQHEQLRVLLLFRNTSDDMSAELKDFTHNLSMAVFEILPYLSFNINEISNTIEKLLPDSISVVISADKIALITHFEQVDVFSEKLIKLALSLEKSFGINGVFAIPNQKAISSDQLYDSHIQALELLKNKHLHSNKIVITSETAFDNTHFSYYYPIETEQSIIENVTSGKYESAKSVFLAVLDKNLKEIHLSSTDITEFKFAIISTIKRLLNMLNKSESEIFGSETVLYSKLEFPESNEELYRNLVEIFDTIMENSEQSFIKLNNILVEKIIEFIKENYSWQDLSLATLAGHFNLTMNHISRTFKKHTNINFKDYLANYRIEKACEILMQTPTVKIVDLSKMVGYDNSSRFIRNFKNIKGVSPGQYLKHKES